MTKGITTILLVLLVAVAFLGIGAFLASGGLSGGRTTLEAVPGQTSGGEQVQVVSTSDINQYTGDVYVNHLFSDLVGNNLTGTCYFYGDTRMASASPQWNDERQWTDASGSYDLTGSVSSGKLQLRMTPGTKWDMHCSFSGYADYFLTGFVVPTSGTMKTAEAESATYGLTQKTVKLAQYDTTAITSSAMDLTVTTNYTDKEYTSTVTRTTTIGKNEKMCLSQFVINSTNGVGDSFYNNLGISKIKMQIGGQPEWTLYDKNAGVNLFTTYVSSTTGSQFDTNGHADYKNLLSMCKVSFAQDAVPSITWKVTANTRDTTSWATGYLSNGNVTANVYAYDNEGNALISNVQITA